MIILSLCTVSILNLDLQILSINGFHLIWLIVNTTSLCLIIVLLLLLYTQVFLWVQYFSTFVQYLGSVLCLSICILCLCMSLLTHMLSYTIHLPITYKYRCLLQLTKCPICTFSTTRKNSCLLSPQKNKHLHNLPTSITVGNVQILYYSIVIVVLCYYQYFIIFFCLSEYACLLSAAVIRHVIVPRPYLLSEEKKLCLKAMNIPP